MIAFVVKGGPDVLIADPRTTLSNTAAALFLKCCESPALVEVSRRLGPGFISLCCWFILNLLVPEVEHEVWGS
jgi:hypothetical protein